MGPLVSLPLDARVASLTNTGCYKDVAVGILQQTKALSSAAACARFGEQWHMSSGLGINCNSSLRGICQRELEVSNPCTLVVLPSLRPGLHNGGLGGPGAGPRQRGARGSPCAGRGAAEQSAAGTGARPALCSAPLPRSEPRRRGGEGRSPALCRALPARPVPQTRCLSGRVCCIHQPARQRPGQRQGHCQPPRATNGGKGCSRHFLPPGAGRFH